MSSHWRSTINAPRSLTVASQFTFPYGRAQMETCVPLAARPPFPSSGKRPNLQLFDFLLARGSTVGPNNGKIA